MLSAARDSERTTRGDLISPRVFSMSKRQLIAIRIAIGGDKRLWGNFLLDRSRTTARGCWERPAVFARLDRAFSFQASTLVRGFKIKGGRSFFETALIFLQLKKA
jgi:hypothetical protein